MHAGTCSALVSIWAAVHSPTGLPFPEVMSQLAALGITRYRVDYITRTITAYTSSTVSTTDTSNVPQADTTPLPSSHEHAYTFGSWDKASIAIAARRAQTGEGSYLDLSRVVVGSGVVEYTVYVGRGKVVYAGGEGEVWVEQFHGGRGDDA